jgi:O-antigen/teichoic acid export membrane protein
MPLSVFSAVPTALQRLDVVNGLNVVFGTATVAGTVGLLLAGLGLVPVLALTVSVSFVAAVSFLVASRRLLPGVSFRPRLHLPTARLLLGFGTLKFANQVATQTIYHLDKFLVAALASVSAVTYYAVPVTIAQRIAALVANVSTAFLPAASELHGRGERRRFEELYLRSTKLVALLVLPTGSLLFVFADPILRYWLGADFARESADVLRVLAAGYVVSALTTMPALACDAVGRPRVTTAFSLASAALNVALSIVLIPTHGILGASFAILVNSALVAPVFLLYVHRRVVPLPLRELVTKSLARPLLAAVASWPAMALLLLVATSLPMLLLALVLGFVAFVVATIALSVYDATDRQVVGASLRPQSSLRATAQ